MKLTYHFEINEAELREILNFCEMLVHVEEANSRPKEPQATEVPSKKDTTNH